MAVVHKVTLSLVHEITLFRMCIEPPKAVTSVRMNIKPTKLTTPLRSIRSLSLQYALSLRDLLPLLREHTKSTESPKTTKNLRLTWPLNNLQESNCLIPLCKGRAYWRLLLKNLSHDLSVFLPCFLLELEGFLLIDLLWQFISSGAVRAPSTVTLFWEVGFLPQFLTGLGGFSVTSVSHSPAFRLEFLFACVLPGCGAVLAFRAITRRFCS